MDLRKRLPAAASCLALVLLLTGANVALGLLPAEQNAEYEIPLRQFDLHSYQSPAVELAREGAVQAFARANDGAWSVYSWNPQTGTPSNMIGSGVQASAAALVSESDVVSVARGVIQAHPDVFKADLANLRYNKAPRGAGKWSVHFQQTYQMLDVWGGRVHLTFTEGGRLFAFGSQYYSGIDVDPQPSFPASVAWEIASRDLPVSPEARFVEEEADLLILPEPITETQVEHHLVWRVRVATDEPVGIWVTHVDAHTGEIVWRYNDVHFLDVQGTTAGEIQRFSYCDPDQEESLPYLRVTVSGVGTTYADVDGNWSVSYGGTDPRTVTADLYSPYVDLNNLGGSQAAFSGTAVPGTPLEVRFDGTNAQNDERDVYQTVNDIHTYFQEVAPEFGYTNQRITAYVRRSGTCNAYWNGTINFYAAGSGCGNTGEMMSVVAHEFGHGVQDAILGYQGDQGLGEGNSDIIGNLMTMDSVMGRGFYLNQCDSGIRNSDNNLQYPDDVIGQPIHSAGRVIAGFQWDAMQAIISQHGLEQGRLMAAQAWHYGRVLEQPTTQPAQVLATFIADDDDGDLTNGTPNYDAFCLGATNHGFDCPEILTGVIIQHTPLASREEEGDAVAIATIYSTDSVLDPDLVQICYEINGGEMVCGVMTPTGNLNEYQGIIPGLSSPSEIGYYLTAEDEAGNSRTSPPMAPTDLHRFDVATVFDNLETDTGWAVNLEGGDNATSGIWERVDPVGTSAQPEDDHTPDPGVLCWVTGQHQPGQGDGFNDVDGGTTTLYTPVYDLTGATLAKVKYYRWYSNDKGAAPGEDSWIVQVRTDGGSWVNIENTTASSNAWVLAEADLLALFGGSVGNVQVRFLASDLGSGSLVEAAVDDFEILAQLSSADVVEGAAAALRFALFPGQPNPMAGRTAISFQVPAQSRVQMNLYDVAGRLVRTLADGDFEAGSHVLDWDGRDADGRPVASGVYFYRMKSGGFDATRSVVVTR